MRSNVNVEINLNKINCYDEADGWGDAEPYLWTVFFKIDGTTVKLGDSLMLEGTATVTTTPGSHGNLGISEVDAGDVVQIPWSLGHFQTTLVPIPVPAFVKAAGTDDLPAVAGVIVVLMEEDNVSDDGAEAGHQALNSAVKSALNSLIATLGISHQQVTQSDIDAITNSVESKVTTAIENQQNFFENFWSWLNADDTIGTKVWQFDTDTMLKDTPMTLDKRWTNDNGDWEMFGEITAAAECPASLINGLLHSLSNSTEKSSDKYLAPLYEFRDNDLSNYRGIANWWALASRNTTSLLRAVKNDGEVAKAAFGLLKHSKDILARRNEPLRGEHHSAAICVLEYLHENAAVPSVKKDVSRSLDALRSLKGRTPNEIFDVLSQIAPARYPSINSPALNAAGLKVKVSKAKTTK